MDNPSQHEANKVLRVLNGNRLKFTVRLHYPAGKILEFQCDTRPKVKWLDEARALWLMAGEYDSNPVTEWVPGSVLLAEENPN